MKIDKILNEMQYRYPYSIINNCNFDLLGLIQSPLSVPFCTFCDSVEFLENALENANIVMILATPKIAKLIERKGVCITEKPRLLFFSMHNYLSSKEEYKRNNFKTTIGKNCNISKLAYICDRNVKIGNNVIIEEFVSIKSNVQIMDNVIIRAGSVIGGEGFEFKRNNGSIMSVVHAGGVIIKNNAEIQYNTCVDKAVYPWDNTVIGEYTKIDNLVYVAHGVKINREVMIVGHSGILGRTIIDKKSKVGLGCALKNAIHVKENSDVSIGAVVTKDIEKGQKVSGNFAIEHKKFLKFIKKIR